MRKPSNVFQFLQMVLSPLLSMQAISSPHYARNSFLSISSAVHTPQRTKELDSPFFAPHRDGSRIDCRVGSRVQAKIP
ncbi:uncharacterized protein IWZ02DRAFT_459727 [Phyllosticta citriasiana]|uniref:uncharacterized protein n=1 Tax=Phyllosticta citriasiana TaxID=595635 RepID=UPI0030FDADF1